MDSEALMAKEPSRTSFTPHTGYLYRDQLPSAKISDQFIWIAKIDTLPGKRPELLKAIHTHTGNVKRTEEGTLSFLVLESKDNETSVTLLERYISEKYFKEVHAVSASMQEYRDKTGPLVKDKVSAGYRIVAGFFDKREVMV
jgi:quinol monooxygenase YgiN